jgi:integrase
MGSYGQCLLRRPGGTYVVRLGVPAAIQPCVGRREVHVSTGHRSRGPALAEAAAIQARWRQCFADLLALNEYVVVHGSPLIADEPALPLLRVASIFDVSPVDLLLGAARHRPLWIFVEARDALQLIDESAIVREDDGRYVMSDIESAAQEIRVSGLVRVHDKEGLVVDLSSGRSSEVLVAFAPRIPGRLFFWPKHLHVNLNDVWLERAAIESVRVEWARSVSSTVAARPQPAIPATGSATAPPEVASTTHRGRHGGRPTSKVIQEFIDRNSTLQAGADRPRWSDGETERNKRKLLMFTDLVGDRPIGDLDLMPEGKKLIERYLGELRRLPTKADMRRAGAELGERASGKGMILWADGRPGTERMSVTTVRSYVEKLSECFAWAISMGYMALNPAQAVVSGAVKARDRPDTQRDTFSVEDLARVFGATWFQTGTARNARGTINAHWRPFYYWLPLMGLHSGARLNELAQLYLDDLCDEAGVPFFWFRLNHPDKISDEKGGKRADQKLKTANSQRKVPIHPLLVEMGLLRYADAVRSLGASRLFPELWFDSEKGYGKAAGSWFNERYLGGQLGMHRDGKKTFHSFRHNFATALQQVGAPDRVRNQLIGHSRGDTTIDVRYSKDVSPAETAEYIAAMRFSLPSVQAFSIPDGIVALQSALRRKASIQSA